MQISNTCVGKQCLRCMAACRICRFYHCLHIRIHFHPHLFLLIHSHARYLACSQKSFPFANGVQFANRTKCSRTGQNVRKKDKMFANGTFMFANGQRSRIGRNIYITHLSFLSFFYHSVTGSMRKTYDAFIPRSQSPHTKSELKISSPLVRASATLPSGLT